MYFNADFSILGQIVHNQLHGKLCSIFFLEHPVECFCMSTYIEVRLKTVMFLALIYAICCLFCCILLYNFLVYVWCDLQWCQLLWSIPVLCGHLAAVCRVLIVLHLIAVYNSVSNCVRLYILHLGLVQDPYMLSMEHHTDWVNDIALCCGGRTCKLVW